MTVYWKYLTLALLIAVSADSATGQSKLHELQEDNFAVLVWAAKCPGNKTNTAVITVNDSGQINYISTNLFKELGYSRHEVIGQRLFNFIDSDEVTAAINSWQYCTQTENENFLFRFGFRKKNGEFIRLEWEGKWIVRTVDEYECIVTFN
jgi:PAS domain S-box-containing protein